MSQHEFYLARAAEARADADATSLENVKERCRRSEAAWNSMAARAERSDKLRKAEANKNTPVILAAE